MMVVVSETDEDGYDQKENPWLSMVGDVCDVKSVMFTRLPPLVRHFAKFPQRSSPR